MHGRKKVQRCSNKACIGRTISNKASKDVRISIKSAELTNSDDLKIYLRRWLDNKSNIKFISHRNKDAMQNDLTTLSDYFSNRKDIFLDQQESEAFIFDEE